MLGDRRGLSQPWPPYYGYPECNSCDMCYYHGTELINGLLSKCEQDQVGVQKCKCKDNYDGNLCDQCKDGKNCERKSIKFLQAVEFGF